MFQKETVLRKLQRVLSEKSNRLFDNQVHFYNAIFGMTNPERFPDALISQMQTPAQELSKQARQDIDTFADEAFNLLSDKQYRALSMFSSNGYAVGTTDYETWEVIDGTGTVQYTFGKIADSSNITISYTNGYLACGGYLIGMTSKYYGVVDLSTGQFTEYANVIAVDGTSCVKVAAESGLWGLYEKDELLYPCVYDSISFDEETRQFTLTRGGEVSYYTPQ